MIRSFKDKMKKKQEAYEAKQKVLAEQAEQARIKKEWELFDLEQEKDKQQSQQILAEEESRQHAEYLRWKNEQKLLNEHEVTEQQVDSGIGLGHMETWVLNWKSFSIHPDIIDLPMSEKIRLYKLAERQQIDRLNYYANLFSDNQHANSLGSGDYWEDGVIDHGDAPLVYQDTLWTHSVDVNAPLTISAGTTLTVQGILTTNALITNYGTIIVEGLLVQNVSVNNLDDGQIIVG